MVFEDGEDGQTPWSAWLHRAVSTLQVIVLTKPVSPEAAARQLAEVATALQNPPTHAEAVIAVRLEDQIRARLQTAMRVRLPGAEPTHPKVAAALRTIRERYHQPTLRLGGVAHDQSISPSRLARLFVQFTGVGFSANLRAARIGAAEELLRSSDMSVKEVAYRAGYGSPAAFDRAFHRQHAMTPLAFRRLHRLRF